MNSALKADMMFGWRPTAPQTKMNIQSSQRAKLVPIPLTFYDVKSPFLGYIQHPESRPDPTFQPKLIFSGFRPQTSF
jgi:hypothetical protein